VEASFPLLSHRRDGPWLAHRLDADTAGCLAVALRRAALLDAQRLFAVGLARKTYWAVVAGVPAREAGVIDGRLAKRTSRSGWRMEVVADGQPALTEWQIKGAADGLAWLELTPRTGRTHQIRVQAASRQIPLVGDDVYGAFDLNRKLRKSILARRLFLHAHELSLKHPASGQPLSLRAPLPPDLAAVLAAAGALYRVDVYLTAFDPGNGWRYFPSVAELLVTFAILSVETMAFLFVVRRFPILPAAHRVSAAPRVAQATPRAAGVPS
jgi:tRNA pseudouridine32 synthase/23S rRNA pseudouridine746 synthase